LLARADAVEQCDAVCLDERDVHVAPSCTTVLEHKHTRAVALAFDDRGNRHIDAQAVFCSRRFDRELRDEPAA
jgi:hypothetical protein